MRAAIYARRSTDEHQAASLDVQIEEARRYIAAKGWTVDDVHIYCEDAVSRAEFVKRPALIRMEAALATHAFDCIVLRDESRMGGDTLRSTMKMLTLIEAGAEIWFYASDQRVTLDDPTSKLIAIVKNFAAEDERAKISSRTREHHLVKARRGFNVGGRVYGYDNVRRDERAPVEYVINEAEAAIVRRIFALYAGGESQRAIAHALNRDGVPSPRAGRRGSGSWAQTQIRAMLRNRRYIGVLAWGEIRKRYRGGTKVRERQSSTDVVTVVRPELRIIDDATWARVAARFCAQPSTPESASRKTKFRHMLSGFAVCARCRGPISVSTARFGARSVKVYYCKHARDRGTCTNHMRRPVEEVNRQVIDSIRTQVLREEVVVDTLRRLRARISARSKTPTSDQSALRKDETRLRREVENLTRSLAQIGHSKAVAEALVAKERELARVSERLAALRQAPAILEDTARKFERDARLRVRELHGLLEEPSARAEMEDLLDGPTEFHPMRDGKRRAFFVVKGLIKTHVLLSTSPPRNDCHDVFSLPPTPFEAIPRLAA